MTPTTALRLAYIMIIIALLFAGFTMSHQMFGAAVAVFALACIVEGVAWLFVNEVK